MVNEKTNADNQVEQAPFLSSKSQESQDVQHSEGNRDVKSYSVDQVILINY